MHKFRALVTIGILYLSLTPSPPSDGLGWDKLNHAAAMSLVSVIAYLSARPAPWSVLFAGLYAMSLRCCKDHAPLHVQRNGLDLLADLVGVALAVLVLKVCSHLKVDSSH